MVNDGRGLKDIVTYQVHPIHCPGSSEYCKRAANLWMRPSLDIDVQTASSGKAPVRPLRPLRLYL